MGLLEVERGEGYEGYEEEGYKEEYENRLRMRISIKKDLVGLRIVVGFILFIYALTVIYPG